MRRGRTVALLAGVALAAAGLVAWRSLEARRGWDAMRPAVPAPVGPRAPGLDGRLQQLSARLEAHPPDEDALVEFALLCHANGLHAPAGAAYRALLQVQPDVGRWPHMLAVIEAGYGRLGDAVPLFRRSTRLAPDHVPGWLNLGAALLKADDVTGARAAYEEALRRAPEDPFALVGLARCALREERWTAARSLLQRAVVADPRMAPAQHLLATVHERLGNQDTAAAVLARSDAGAMEVDPPDPWIDDLHLLCHDIYRLRVVAVSSLEAGHVGRSLAACERALALAPQDARVHWQYGRIHMRLGRLPEARRHLEQAVSLDPGDEKALVDLIGVLQEMGDGTAVAERTAELQSRFGGTLP